MPKLIRLYIVNVAIGFALSGVFLGALSAYGWHKVSGLHGRGYGAALAYWHLGASSFGRTPPSSARHFVR